MPEKRVKSFTVRQVGAADSDPHYELRYVFVAPGVPEFPVVTHLREYMRHRRADRKAGEKRIKETSHLDKIASEERARAIWRGKGEGQV